MKIRELIIKCKVMCDRFLLNERNINWIENVILIDILKVKRVVGFFFISEFFYVFFLL